MTEQRTTGKTDSAAEAIAAAIGRLGEATAAAISAEAGVAYSTTNKKLRILREAGRAQSFDGADNRTVWRLTNTADTAPCPGGQPDKDTSRTDEDGSRTDGTTPPSEQPAAEHPAAGPNVTVVPAEVLDQLTDEPDPSAVPPGDGDTDATTGAATVAAAGDQLLAALDGPAGQPVVVPAVGVQAEPDAAAAVVPDGGQAGPPDGTARADATDTDDAKTDDHEAGAEDADQVGEHEPSESDASAPARRAGGTLRGAILDILEAHPDQQYKVGELCKLIDAANAGTDVAKASQGAVANALDTLSRKGTVTRTVDRPATFQLTPAPTD